MHHSFQSGTYRATLPASSLLRSPAAIVMSCLGTLPLRDSWAPGILSSVADLLCSRSHTSESLHRGVRCRNRDQITCDSTQGSKLSHISGLLHWGCGGKKARTDSKCRSHTLHSLALLRQVHNTSIRFLYSSTTLNRLEVQTIFFCLPRLPRTSSGV